MSGDWSEAAGDNNTRYMTTTTENNKASFSSLLPVQCEPVNLPMLTRWQVHFFLLTEFLMQDHRDWEAPLSKSSLLYLLTSLVIVTHNKTINYQFSLIFLCLYSAAAGYQVTEISSVAGVRRWEEEEDGGQGADEARWRNDMIQTLPLDGLIDSWGR